MSRKARDLLLSVLVFKEAERETYFVVYVFKTGSAPLTLGVVIVELPLLYQPGNESESADLGKQDFIRNRLQVNEQA